MPLSKLDVREYPLAMKETPAELTDLSYTEDETREDIQRQENEFKLRDMMMQEFERRRADPAYRDLIRQVSSTMTRHYASVLLTLNNRVRADPHSSKKP